MGGVQEKNYFIQCKSINPKLLFNLFTVQYFFGITVEVFRPKSHHKIGD